MKPETRKDEIINTAAKLFRERGYSAVTMRDLAKAMGIKAASLYNHIDSKQDILKEIIISLAEEFIDGMKLIKAFQGNSIEKLKQIIKLHVDITARNTFGMASLNNDWMHLEEKSLEYFLQLRLNFENDFRNILIEGIRVNEIVDSNVDVTLFSMHSTLRSLYLWFPKKEDLDPKELANILSNVLIHGVNN